MIRAAGLDPAPVGRTNGRPRPRWSTQVLWATRAALVTAIGISLLFPDWEQFQGKGMAYRAPFYLLPLVVVPVVWRRRGRPEPYPDLIDALVIAPFLADTLGNVFGFYDTYAHTDDVLHFLNWVLLMGGVTLGLCRTYLRPLAAWAMGTGIGASAIIGWETAEWFVQKLGTTGLHLTYSDTIGDLVLSTTGGAIGAALAVWYSMLRYQLPADPAGPAGPAGTTEPDERAGSAPMVNPRNPTRGMNPTN